MRREFRTSPAFERKLFVIVATFCLVLCSAIPSVKAQSSNSAQLVEELNRLDKAGDFRQALSLAKILLERVEKEVGPAHPGTAMMLTRTALLHIRLGDNKSAAPLLQRAVSIFERTRGAEHPETVLCIRVLATVYCDAHDYARAEPLLKRTLNNLEKSGDFENLTLTVNSLADLYIATGDSARAELLLQRGLVICDRSLSADHPASVFFICKLASLYSDRQEYGRAASLFERALAICERGQGSVHKLTVGLMFQLAKLYITMGEYSRAEPLLKRAVSTCERDFGPLHEKTADALNLLGVLYLETHDYESASQFLMRALKIRERLLGLEHPDTASVLNNLSHVWKGVGNKRLAEETLQKALKIWEKVLGPEHPETLIGLTNLASLYVTISDYARAEPLLQRILKIREKTLGLEHVQTALTIKELAALYCEQGDQIHAAALYQRALNVFQKALGPEHPYTANLLYFVACQRIDVGDPAAALTMARRMAVADKRTLGDVLTFTTERQRLSYVARLSPYDLFATLGDAEELGEVALRHKGLVLDSLLEDRLVAQASNDPGERARIEELYLLKQQLARLRMQMIQGSGDSGSRQRAVEREALQARTDALEAEMARRVAGLGRARRALSVTSREVQAVLPPQTALVELVRYSHYLGRGNFGKRYGAVIFTPQESPKWVPLGDAGSLDVLVRTYRSTARGEGRSVVVSATSMSTTDAETSKILHAMHDSVWAPIAAALPGGTKSVIISPDGQLNFVSFATLLDPSDRFVAESMLVRYVASGRDLLRATPNASGKQIELFGAPDFDHGEGTVVAKSTKTDAGGGAKPPTTSPTLWAADFKSVGITSFDPFVRGNNPRDLAQLSFSPLPGTAVECAGIRKVASSAGWTPTVAEGPRATESALNAVNAPRVLHLATHGFFLPESRYTQSDEKQGRFTSDFGAEPGRQKSMLNPMLRSGIALAGANVTLEAWKHGEAVDPARDGILTAEEAGGLKLSGTWLVVLSACDTGSGEVVSGEGVMGLRRGFVQAGAQNLLMTLWPIADAETARFMQDFYRAALCSGDAPGTLAQVQRDWLVRLRKERGLSVALRLAGPFIVSSQGKP